MAIRLLTSAADLALYDAWVKKHPQGTLWQSVEWKAYQEALGREVRVYMDSDDAVHASAMVVIDRTTGGFSTWDIQRGPLGPVIDNGKLIMENLLSVIVADAKKDKCLSIYLSPKQELSIFNFQFSIHSSQRHEQPEATRMLDLTLSDDDLLKQMHQKGRYNMKVAEKNGIRIEESTDVEAYAKMASDTAKRDGFSGGSTKRYQKFLEKIPGSFLLLAYPESRKLEAESSSSPVAGLIGVVYGKTGIYYYGASDYTHRALMAPYLLQWQAIQHCKAAGCTQYDLLGIAPPVEDPESRKPKAESSRHPWAGISDFKAKFGGIVVTYPPEQEIILQPLVRSLLHLKRRVLG